MNVARSKDEWLAARRKLLAKEKELTHLRDALSVERRALPWLRIEKQYLFDTPAGRKSLTDLFDGRPQGTRRERRGDELAPSEGRV